MLWTSVFELLLRETPGVVMAFSERLRSIDIGFVSARDRFRRSGQVFDGQATERVVSPTAVRTSIDSHQSARAGSKGLIGNDDATATEL